MRMGFLFHVIKMVWNEIAEMIAQLCGYRIQKYRLVKFKRVNFIVYELYLH